MGMALPEKPPLMMVESSALNDAEEREGRSSGGHSHSHGPVFHTRGLTLTVEYRAIQQVVTRDGRRFTQPVDLSNRDRFEVSFTQHSSRASCLRPKPIAAAFLGRPVRPWHANIEPGINSCTAFSHCYSLSRIRFQQLLDEADVGVCR